MGLHTYSNGEKSKVLLFLNAVFVEWKRLPNGVMHRCMGQVLKTAIASMKFDIDDFAEISKCFLFHEWCGNDRHMSGEEFYSLACESNNVSAARSFEKWKNRKPFFVNRLNGRSRGRVGVGGHFWYLSQSVTVTSFSEDMEHMTACSYNYPVVNGRYQDRVLDKRFRISHADLKKKPTAISIRKCSTSLKRLADSK